MPSLASGIRAAASVGALLVAALLVAACGSAAEVLDSSTPTTVEAAGTTGSTAVRSGASTQPPTTADAPTPTADAPTPTADAPTTTTSVTTTESAATAAAVEPDLVNLVGGGQFDLNSVEGTDTVLWFWAPW